MKEQPKTLDEVQAILKTLRSNRGFRRKFPKEIWNSIIQLTKVHSFPEICQRLGIQPAYLKRKMQRSQEHIPNSVDFQEISCNIQGLHQADTVIIELMSHSGLRARIQGSATCLNCLSSLFGGVDNAAN